MKLFHFKGFSLLSIATFLLFISCKDPEPAIRAKVEAEFNQKLEALMQLPKNVLSSSDMKIVTANFNKANLIFGDTTQICKLSNGTNISFYFDKDLKYNLIASYDGVMVTALIPVYVLATAHPDVSKKIVQSWCENSRSPGCAIGDLGNYELRDPKLGRLIYSIELSSCGTDCPLCVGLTGTDLSACQGKCYIDCIKAVRGY